MKTEAYFKEKIKELRAALYTDIYQLATMFMEGGEACFMYPHKGEQILFYKATTDTLEYQEVADILMDQKGICIYPKSHDFLPYPLTSVIHIHDLMTLRAIVEGDCPRFALYQEIKALAIQLKGERNSYSPQMPVETMRISFLRTSLDQFEKEAVKNIIVQDQDVFIYPVSDDFKPHSLSRVANIPDLELLKTFLKQET
ncbi:hypothetical protein [Spongiimicrobium salis]|uniref:hypothetical protein n=1 Tax=Spongiimicrobium salis TaxID=1667022 RepID=UPI00374DD02C